MGGWRKTPHCRLQSPTLTLGHSFFFQGRFGQWMTPRPSYGRRQPFVVAGCTPMHQSSHQADSVQPLAYESISWIHLTPISSSCKD